MDAAPAAGQGVCAPLQPDPELAVLHCCFLSHSVNSQVLLLQHPGFQRAHPSAKQLGTLGGDAGLPAKQQQKKKRKSSAMSLCPPRGATAQDTLGKQGWWLQPRLRNDAGLRLDP